MSFTPTSHHNAYPTGSAAYAYDSRRPSGTYPLQPGSERLPPMLEQPPRYHSAQQYSTFPAYGDVSRMYQSQTPPLPPPHARLDYRYNPISNLPTPQPSFNGGTPVDREYAGHLKKRKLSSDISVYSLSVNNATGEDGPGRADSYLRNPPTPNISTPSSTERPSVELQSSRPRSQMTEQDKHELKKEKNREKQRRLRSRRAEQLNSLEHLNAEKDARLEHLELKVKRFESEAIQREEKWQRWVLELESRLAQARKRCKALEAASSGVNNGESEQDTSISREIGDVRIRFGVQPLEGGMEMPMSYSTAESTNAIRVDDRMSGMFRANMRMAPGATCDTASPLETDLPVRPVDVPANLQLSSIDRHPHSGSPLSIQALLSPNLQNPAFVLSPQLADTPKENNVSGLSSPKDDGRQLATSETSVRRGSQATSFMEDIDPSVAMAYMKMLNNMQRIPDQPLPFPDATIFMETEIEGASKVLVQPQQPESDSILHSTADMSEAQILALTDSNLLHIARSLIRDKLPPSMYTPEKGTCNTSMEEEQRDWSSRSRNYSDASTLVEGGSENNVVQTPWRDTFTPSELYILYRALMFACHPSGSKAFFDGKRISELSPSQRAVYERWAAYDGRDKRVDMVPAMILRMRIILCDELQDKGALTVTAYLSDTLHEAIIYGNPWSMYCWELSDAFWDRWSAIFPSGREFCGALRAWRRKDRHYGSRPFEIIMGTEEPDARRRGGLELPPAGWSDGLIGDTDA